MRESSTRVQPTWLEAVVLGVATALLVVAATFVMFSAFMYYDDEGYVLLSLRNYAEHGGLYREVYSQYGPFPFVAYHALQALGLPLTHTVGRLLTVGTWAGMAIACAAMAGYATRNLIARLAVLAGVFVYLWVMASEPTHPGGLIGLLVALLAVFGYKWIARDRLVAWALLAGGITAALLLTKINIGVFAAFATCTWWALHHRNDSVRQWAPWVLGACTVAMPFALMRPLLGTPWVQDYALVFAGGGLATVLAVAAGATGRVGGRELGVGLAAAGGVAVIVLGAIFLRGTTPAEMLEGVLLGPLRHPASFSLRFVWPPGIRWIAFGSLLAAITASLLRQRDPARVDRAVAYARMVVAALLAIVFARFPGVSPDYLTFGCALPGIWLFVWPLGGASSGAAQPRSWLALLLLGQCLHAFPVPGSQMAWGSFLAIPLVVIGAWDAATWLAHRPHPGWFARRPVRLTVQVALIALIGALGWSLAKVGGRYRHGQNLGLSGAEMIRLPDQSSALFRVLTMNAAAHGDLLFSLPGMFSLNLWTDLPTPTKANVTHWFSLLDEARQQAIIDALKAAPRACVIIDRGHVEFLTERSLAPKGRLLAYIESEFETAFTVDRFEFRVHRGRRIEPYLLAESRVRAAAADGPHAESTLLTVSLLVPPRGPIASIELLPAVSTVKLNATNTRVEVTTLSPRGIAAGEPQRAAWPLQLVGPSRLSFYYDRERLSPVGNDATIVFRDADGAEIGLARVRR